MAEDTFREHELALALRSAYLAMHRRAEACLAAGGVTAEQFVVLAALTRGDSLTQQELVGRTASDANTLRGILVLLEQRGLVQRSPHPTDRRARSVALTAEGRAVFERLWEMSQPFRQRLSAGLEQREVAELLRLLRRLAESMAVENRAN